VTSYDIFASKIILHQPWKMARSPFHEQPIPAAQLLKLALSEMGISARAFDRILRVARTIADLNGSEVLSIPEISEAIQYRSLDRELW